MPHPSSAWAGRRRHVDASVELRLKGTCLQPATLANNAPTPLPSETPQQVHVHPLETDQADHTGQSPFQVLNDPAARGPCLPIPGAVRVQGVAVHLHPGASAASALATGVDSQLKQ